MHQGILNDQRHRERLILSGTPLCEHCDGTGNELYSMYRRCPVCGGSGQATRLGPPDPRVPWSPGIHQPGCQTLITPQWPCSCTVGAPDWRAPAQPPRHEVWAAPQPPAGERADG